MNEIPHNDAAPMTAPEVPSATAPVEGLPPVEGNACWASSDLTPDLAQLPVLSIRQPWAWLICHGGKDIENRSWPTRFRGKFLVHASKGMTRDEYEEASWTADDNGVMLPPYEQLERGGIVGEAEIVDCVNRSESPWFFGEYGFLIRNAKPLSFHQCKGALGFFRLPTVHGSASSE